MPSPAEMMQVLLVDEGFASLPIDTTLLPGDGKWLCFVDSMPNEPEECIACFGGAGLIFGRLHKTGVKPEHQGVKLLLRSPSPETGWDKANAIAKFFDTGTLSPRVLRVRDSACYLHTVHRTSNVLSLGEQKETRLWMWSLNARLVMQEPETSPLDLAVE